MPHTIPADIQPVATGTTALVGEAAQGPTDQAVVVTGLAEFQQTFGGPQAADGLFVGASQFFANGGRRAWIVRRGARGAAGLRRALEALDLADEFDLLCLPGSSARGAIASGAADARRRGVLFIADPGPTRAATLEALGSIRPADGGHAAMYFPRLEVPDALASSTTVRCGPAASVAGVLARTDRARGVWAAAAGTEASLQGPVGLAVAIDDREADSLRAEGLNVIREIAGHGIVLWGARTVAGADEWRYVPVRRMALFLEASIERGIEWAVFEPNDEPAWSRIRALVWSFMNDLFGQGAFAGRTPDDSFFVRCGLGTMTQRDIDRGVVVVEVGFAPLRPGEFVVVRIRRRRR